MIAPGFEKVQDTFADLLRQHPGSAQVTVRYQGQVVADLYGSAPGSPAVDAQTPFIVFSVSKVFTTLAVLRLLEEGRLDLDAPIARYWPEFAQGGKETATVRHALLHQAGIPAPHLRLQVPLWPFWGLVTRDVASSKAQFIPGTQTAYHLVNFGFILGEVVRRVSGEPIDRYLQRAFFGPMGLQNTWMRVSADGLRRSPRLTAASPSMQENSRLFNLPIMRRALLPAAGLHSTARELAAVFQMLLDCGEYQGQRFLRPETIALAARSHYNGYDSYIQGNMNWGLGFIIGGGAHRDPDPEKWSMGRGSSEATFAGLGMGTCMAWADRRAGLVTAFTCNAMLGDSAASQRWAAISSAVWDCVEGK